MVKKVNFVDSRTLLSGDVLATISTAGLDGMEFEEWLVEKYGSNDSVRQAVREAIEEASDEEATLYVPERRPVSMVVLPKTNAISFLDKAFRKTMPAILKTMSLGGRKYPGDLKDRLDDDVSNFLEALFYYMAKNSGAYKTEICRIHWKYILECARMHLESPYEGEEAYRQFTLDTVVLYVCGSSDMSKAILAEQYEDLNSVAYQIIRGIFWRFGEVINFDPRMIRKDARGFHFLLNGFVNTKERKICRLCFEFTTSDDEDMVEMEVTIDGECGHGDSKDEKENPHKSVMIFTVPYKGIGDFAYLDNIEELMSICFKGAAEIAA